MNNNTLAEAVSAVQRETGHPFPTAAAVDLMGEADLHAFAIAVVRAVGR